MTTYRKESESTIYLIEMSMGRNVKKARLKMSDYSVFLKYRHVIL